MIGREGGGDRARDGKGENERVRWKGREGKGERKRDRGGGNRASRREEVIGQERREEGWGEERTC